MSKDFNHFAWTRYGILLILLLAFAIQFHALGGRTYHGDELGSILEAQNLGRNANSLPYFAWLRLWTLAGNGEFWLRSMSALAAVSAVALTYVWVRKLAGAPTAREAALVLGTSPFLIAYSQQVRFYTLALAAACFCIWAFTLALNHLTPRTLALWAVSAVIAVAALLLNGLLIVGQTFAVFGLTNRLRPRAKIIIALAASVLAVLLIAAPPVRQFVFDTVAAYTNANSRYVASRGLTLTQIAKIPLSIFFFIFGESVYPLTLAVVVPGVILFGFTAVAGLVKLWRDKRAFWMVAACGTLPLGLLFLVLDPLAPPSLQGAAPRYLIFLLPLLYFVIAVGARHKLAWLIVPLLLVNCVSLALYGSGDWAYSDDLVNWRTVTQWAAEHVTAGTGFVLDGRAQELANYYFPSAWERQTLPSQQLENPRLILLSNDFHSDVRAQTSAQMERMSHEYDQTDAWGKYPLFEYVYERKSGSLGTYRVDSSGRVNIPTEIYGIEFQDIQLPIPMTFAGQAAESFGAFGLPGLNGQMARSIPLAQPTPASKVWIMSDMVGANPEKGAVLGTLQITATDGSAQAFSLRAGMETATWNGACQPSNCSSAYTWRKRLALVGNESYPGSWQEFNASIFAEELKLNPPTTIREVEIKRIASPGTLYVWGIMLQP